MNITTTFYVRALHLFDTNIEVKLFINGNIFRQIFRSSPLTIVLSDSPVDTLCFVTKALLHTVRELSVGPDGERNKVRRKANRRRWSSDLS